MNTDLLKKNVPNWVPSESDYRLVFRQIDGIWREISGNLPRVSNIVLADYLSQLEIDLPDGCTFMRIDREGWHFQLKQHGGLIIIDVEDKRL